MVDDNDMIPYMLELSKKRGTTVLRNEEGQLFEAWWSCEYEHAACDSGKAEVRAAAENMRGSR